MDKILREPALTSLALCVRREIIAEAVRVELQRLRDGEDSGEEDITAGAIAERVKARLTAIVSAGIQPVINATGVILSTNLGRAPLPDLVLEKMTRALSSYSSLEFDLSAGTRGERTRPLAEMLRLLVGSQSAIVVNNCAAAVMLAVQTLASGREVIVSRGELIEIGGSFRLPDVIAAAGGILKEVGTTNRTRLSDYEKAIGPATGLILKCHRSNFEIVGFTEECELADLSAMARAKGVPFCYDLGGGCLVDLSQYGLSPEPTVGAALASGVDLVLFSGDKLLGGPQAGLICGQAEAVGKLRKSPVYRALRPDKMVLAMLESVVAQYLIEGGADNLPVFQLAALTRESLAQRVNLFIDRFAPLLTTLEITGSEMVSTMGGGSLPGETLPGYGLKIRVREAKGGEPGHRKISEAKLAGLLRENKPPVIVTTNQGYVQLDFRTIKEGEEELLGQALQTIQSRLLLFQ